MLFVTLFVTPESLVLSCLLPRPFLKVLATSSQALCLLHFVILPLASRVCLFYLWFAFGTICRPSLAFREHVNTMRLCIPCRLRGCRLRRCFAPPLSQHRRRPVHNSHCQPCMLALCWCTVSSTVRKRYPSAPSLVVNYLSHPLTSFVTDAAF